MDSQNHQYFAGLLEEQRSKQLAFDEQITLELLGLEEPVSDKDNRQEYMKYLANRILQINSLMEKWLNAIELNVDRFVK
ncbi:hypothetical protein MUGA111182_13480 [Mucilaginibacter galii]|uniref:Uncharacterized protein n=1 Tax=Mucilaginibacter galii TaxID=2005073 RepID=A0A917J4X9_9SPHI|nr:hypothetical protein [Mucilaginibacter galii]GGI49225.1 hypothetical protein GCM10011425_04370 [Mucilaginibacter galii]